MSQRPAVANADRANAHPFDARQLRRYASTWLPLLAIALSSLLVNLTWHEAVNAADAKGFPRKPIKVIVYTKPGGSADLTARRFVEVASRHSGATFVVENKPGAGGIVAMEKVLQMRADGHTLCICTKSNISKCVSAGREGYLDAFDWIAMLMVDPECVITMRNSSLASWDAILADAKQKAGKQIWVGPDAGGLDHVMALQIWEKFGMQAQWSAFKSGGTAIAALLRGEGVAYVGNPGDAAGNPELRVAAVSAPQRLPTLPDTPTFRELGIQDFDDEYMWRGFAVKQGCPPAALDWYNTLFEKVSADPKWRAYWEKDGIEVVYKRSPEFTEIIQQDRAEFNRYLQQLDMIPDVKENSASAFASRVSLWLLCGGASIWAYFTATTPKNRWLVPLGLGAFALLLWLQTYSFPSTEGVSAATVPRLWIGAILILAFANTLMVGKAQPAPVAAAIDSVETESSTELGGTRDAPRSLLPVLTATALLAVYTAATVLIGYKISTALFLIAMMRLLGHPRWTTIIAVTAAWLVFAYVTFEKTLYVPLPSGQLWEWMS